MISNNQTPRKFNKQQLILFLLKMIMVIQLTIAINFVYSKDYNNEEHVLHSNSDNIKININGKELIFHQKKMI